MIEEQATVVDVEAEQFTVQTQRKSSCNSCAASKGCGTAVLSKTMGKKHAIVSINKRAADEPSLSPGDQVIIGINENMLMSGSSLAYLLPLAMMMGVGLLAQWFGVSFGFNGELHIILAAIAGLLVGLVLSRFYLLKGSRRADFAPVLVRKLQQVTPVRDNILLP